MADCKVFLVTLKLPLASKLLPKLLMQTFTEPGLISDGGWLTLLSRTLRLWTWTVSGLSQLNIKALLPT